MTLRQRRRGRVGTGGWTLVELLMVLAIVGILSSLTMLTMQDMIERARVAKAIGDIEAIQLIRRSTEPLAQLQDGTRRLAAVDLSHPVQVASHDEFPDLASSFNTMASLVHRGNASPHESEARPQTILETAPEGVVTTDAGPRSSGSTRGLFILYHIEYHDADGPTALDFRYVPSPQPLIRLEHLSSVWRRTTRR